MNTVAKTEHFIIIGGQRCGSGYLYRMLSEHPEILMNVPEKPEPKYFLAPINAPLSSDEYVNRFFVKNKASRLLGEKSVSYMETPRAAKNIRRCLGKIKILVILRDPVHRAVSNYWFSRHHGYETRSLNDALSNRHKNPRIDPSRRPSVSPYLYLTRGRYSDQLETYAHIFGKERIHIIILEKLANERKSLKELFAFLGVDQNFLPPSFEKIFNRREKPDQAERLTENNRRRLASYYLKSNQKLASMFNLDLTTWLS